MGPSNTMNRNFTSIQRLKSDLVLFYVKRNMKILGKWIIDPKAFILMNFVFKNLASFTVYEN